MLANNGNEAVAEVNGTVITKDELFDEMFRFVGQEVLDELINIRLIEEEAVARDVNIDDRIEAEIEALSAQFGGLEQLEFVLFQQGMTRDDLVRQLRPNLLLQALLEPEINIDPAMLRQVYEDNEDAFIEEEAVQARHILVNTLEEAEELRARVVDGEDFSALAREHSTDAGSGAAGGELGWFGRGVMVAPFEEAAFALDVGELSEPVRSDFGYHLIIVDDRRDAGLLPFEGEVEQVIREQLTLQQMEQMVPEFLQSLRNEADVRILLGN